MRPVSAHLVLIPDLCSLIPESCLIRPGGGWRRGTQSTGSRDPAPKRGRGLRRWRPKWKGWETEEIEGSDPRTSATTAHSRWPSRCTSAAVRAKTAHPAPASAEFAGEHVGQFGAQVWAPTQVRTLTRGPGLRRAKAVSIPTAEAFFDYARCPRFPPIRQFTSVSSTRQFTCLAHLLGLASIPRKHPPR